MLEELIERWGYLAVGIGVFLEGETVLIAAGTLCHRGLLSPPLVWTAGFAGSVAWSQFWFRTGKRFGLLGLQRRPDWHARAVQLERWMTRHASLFVIGFRFVAGMGTVSPTFLGATGYPLHRFIAFDSLGAALWTIVFGSIGWAIAAGLTGLVGPTALVSELLAIAVTASCGLWLMLRLLRRRTASSE
jgi:membrane protein DedA with SNARE-associated domain